MTKFLYARDYYGKALIELGERREDIVVLDGDLSGSTRTAKFGAKFPERFFNMGVAEQNLMATAGGLASCGLVVYASSFAVFATGRPWDQIRNTICMNNLNVKIVATHAGITVGEDGASHQANEDIAIMRAIPNMKVVVPADAYETYEAIKEIADIEGPVYVRLGRAKVPVVEERKQKFKFGKGYILKRGKKADKSVCIVACGLMVYNSLRAAQILEKDGFSCTVINMPTVKPIDKDLLIDVAAECDFVVTCEEHSIVGGLGSAVCEAISCKVPKRICLIGIEDVFGQSGSPDELLKAYGLDVDGIVKRIREFAGET